MILGMIRYFSDSKESHWLTSSISTFGISLSLVYIVFIPFDIYLTSSGQESFTVPFLFVTMNIKTMYSILCLLIVVFCIVILPFGFFYIEEGVDETYANSEFSSSYHRDYIDDMEYTEDLSYWQKLFRAFQHTMLFIVC